MYAIVEISGKQYKVEKDMVLNVDKIKGHNSGEVTVDKVLMCVNGEQVLVGQPYLANVKIVAKVLGVVKGKKVRGVKFHKRKNYQRTMGHRTQYLHLKIEELAIA